MSKLLELGSFQSLGEDVRHVVFRGHWFDRDSLFLDVVANRKILYINVLGPLGSAVFGRNGNRR